MTESGVIESVEEMEEGGWRVTLASGEEVAVGTGRLSGGWPEPGDLLVLASSETAHTTVNVYATLRPRADGYVLNEPARADGSHIVFRNGLRLPKARGFDPGTIEDDGRYPSFREGFCVNSAGEVVGYGSACP